MKKFIKLWKVTPADCLAQLIIEFVLMPKTFEARYRNEIIFQNNLRSGWR